MMVVGVLIVAAVLLTLGTERLGITQPRLVSTSPVVVPDVTRRSGADPEGGGPVSVKVDGELLTVSLACGKRHQAEILVESGRARFEEVPGKLACTLTAGEVLFEPVFRGDKIECTIGAEDREDACAGGVARERPATLAVASDGAAVLFVDDIEAGPLPVTDHLLLHGDHDLRVAFAAGGELTWTLRGVRLDEQISAVFPPP